MDSRATLSRPHRLLPDAPHGGVARTSNFRRMPDGVRATRIHASTDAPPRKDFIVKLATHRPSRGASFVEYLVLVAVVMGALMAGAKSLRDDARSASAKVRQGFTPPSTDAPSTPSR